MFNRGETVHSKSWQPVLDQGKRHRAQPGFILMSTDLAAESDFFDMARGCCGSYHPAQNRRLHDERDTNRKPGG